MQPVFGLVPDERARPVEDVRCDLVADVRREVVHRHGVGGCQGEHRAVEPVPLEVTETAFLLGVLTHAHPHIGVEDIRARGRLSRVGHQLERASVRGGVCRCGADDVGVWRVAGR